MTVDAQLADRVRTALADQEDVREARMFGGLVFMVNEQMAVCVGAGGGALLVRVSPSRDAEYLEAAGARRGEMSATRSMGPGWIAVDAAALTGDAGLHFWIAAALEHNAERTATP